MPAGTEVPLYDAIVLSNIPPEASAVAGYVDGRWATWPSVMQRWPHARHVSITVTGGHEADIGDVEAGNMTVQGALNWIRQMRALGHPAPGLYASLDTWCGGLQDELLRRYPRSAFRVWTAHYTYAAHRCGPSCDRRLRVPVDATQWTDRSHGRDLDESRALTTFFTAHTQGGSPAGR
jgi:hypothetical protein